MTNPIFSMSDLAAETYIKILKINPAANTYEVIRNADPEEQLPAVMPGSYSEYCDWLIAHEHVFRDDIVDFKRFTDPEKILSYFRKNGQQQSNFLCYRRKAKDDNYRSCMLKLLPAPDYSEENISFYLFVQELNPTATGSFYIADIFRALSDHFSYLMGLDSDTGLATIYRSPDTEDMIGFNLQEKEVDYRTYFKFMLDRFLLPEDKEKVSRLNNIRHIQDQLRYIESFTEDFRISRGGEICWIRAKYARLDSVQPAKMIAIGLSDITDEKRKETDFYKDGKKILIVEDNEINLEMLTAILENDYPILKAGNGMEALEILEEKHEEIAIVITDIRMPHMDGLELLKTIKSSIHFSSIPVIVATGVNDEAQRNDCFLAGAADYISKPYNPVIIQSRVRFMIQYREATNLLHVLEEDSTTGLLTKEAFYRKAQQLLERAPDKKYRLICTDIEGFKMIVEKHGTRAGDEVLNYVAVQLSSRMPGFVLGGRIAGDVLAFLREAVPIEPFYAQMTEIRKGGPVPNLVIKYGIADVRRGSDIQTVCNHAQAAITTIKQVYGVYHAEYNSLIRETIIRQKRILDSMESALKEHQFTVYYQPEHDLKTNTTCGAEALVRWIHPDYGFMNPGDFIPLFEKNGFIRKMDEYVIEQVCNDILYWTRNDLPLLPVSINLSRRDFDRDGMAEYILELADRMSIPHHLLHFEVTESAFVDNPARVTRAVDMLHAAGFVIELDDFGTGYSSLATLNNTSMDVLKIDMTIVHEDDPDAQRNVLELCMKVAEMMKMKTIAEGVETEAQVIRLRSMGCDCIQGFYYSRPLARDAYEEYLLHNSVKIS